MTHVFVAPHPDDVALSCGGLIASLRELGQSVTIITVFSGNGATSTLTPYQREALGFGSKAIWPTTEAFNRSNIRGDRPLDAAVDAPYLATADRMEATQADADAAAKNIAKWLTTVPKTDWEPTEVTPAWAAFEAAELCVLQLAVVQSRPDPSSSQLIHALIDAVTAGEADGDDG